MAFAGGTGTSQDPYLVSTAAQLNDVRNNLTAYYKQTADIDLFEYENWEPIGKINDEFYGSYDGGNFKIENLTINAVYIDKPNNYIGLFGVVQTANIKNCFVYGNIAVTTNSRDFVGGVCASAYQSIIENVHFMGAIAVDFNPLTYEDMRIGGLLGRSNYCTIVNCYTESYITAYGNSEYGSWFIGGLLGVFDTGKIEYCHSAGYIGVLNRGGWIGGFIGRCINVLANDNIINKCFAVINIKNLADISYIGGFVGGVNNGSNIMNCFSVGMLEGSSYIGGFVGNIGSGNGLINTFENCYVACQITTDISERVGAFAPYVISPRNFISCYFNKDMFLVETNSVIPKTTAEMKLESSYENWDFDIIWGIDPSINNGFPYLLPLTETGLNVHVITDTGLKQGQKAFIITDLGLKEILNFKAITNNGLK